MSIICSNCGTKISSETNFCSSCGTNLRSSDKTISNNICVNCGSNLKHNSNFCEICGYKISDYFKNKKEFCKTTMDELNPPEPDIIDSSFINEQPKNNLFNKNNEMDIITPYENNTDNPNNIIDNNTSPEIKDAADNSDNYYNDMLHKPYPNPDNNKVKEGRKTNLLVPIIIIILIIIVILVDVFLLFPHKFFGKVKSTSNNNQASIVMSNDYIV